MASFMVKQMVGSKISDVKGKFGGDDKPEQPGGASEQGEDPEVIQARIEAEERRKEKHRKAEAERERMRQGIREKYNLNKKDEGGPGVWDEPGRIGGSSSQKTDPMAAGMEGADDDSLVGQLNGLFGKTKAAVGGITESVKGMLPFGK